MCIRDRQGQEVTIKQPRDAIQHSVALLTEDRRATGIMGVLSVADNISIASLDALRKGPIMLDDKMVVPPISAHTNHRPSFFRSSMVFARFVTFATGV